MPWAYKKSKCVNGPFREQEWAVGLQRKKADMLVARKQKRANESTACKKANRSM
jgi:hypothetical protein